MLKQLRERTKTILWIVVVAFVVSIFAVWGMNLRTGGPERTQNSDVAGSVDGETIYRRAYMNTLNEIYNQMKMQKGEDYTPTASEHQMLSEQAWELTIQGILMKREINKLGITVTDNELVLFLRSNPHPSLRQVFKTEDGKFDYQAYWKALADPEADWSELEKWGRSILPSLKLENYLSAQIHIPDREVLERFKKESAAVKANYVKIPFQKEDPPYEPTDAEITALYEETKDDFKEFEKRQIRVIEIEKKPTEIDELDVRERLLEIRAEIIKSDDFSKAAKNYSNDNMSAPNGGDLGFFGKGEMVSEFEEAVFSLEVGEISEPVRTQFGYHLIKVEEKKIEDSEEKVRARHVLMRVEPGYETIDSLKTLIGQVLNAIKENGFEEAAKALNFTIKDPPPFSRGSFITDFGYLPRVVNFAFNHRTGNISSPIESENSVYIVKIIGTIPERIKPLDEIRPQLVERVRRKREKEAGKKIADSLRKEALASGDLEAVAHSMELEIETTPLFKENESIPGVGVNTALAKACHLLTIDKLSTPIKGRDAYYMIIVTERTRPDMDEFTNKSRELLNQKRSELASNFMAGWYEVIRKDAKVVDLRQAVLD